MLLFIYGFFHIRAKPATHISLIILAAMIGAELLFQPQKGYFIPALFYYACFCFIGNSITVRLESSARESFSTIAGLEEQRQLAVIAQLRADLERARAENEKANAIHERARAEKMMSATLAQREQLIQTMKTKSDERDRFVRAAYHDTMQPLAAISAFTFAAAQQIRTNDFSHCEHHLLAIDAAAKDIESMFRGIYDFFQIGTQPIHLRPITVNQIIEATCARQKPLAEKKSLALKCRKVRSDNVAIMSDETLLKRLIENLTSNAIKYTDRGALLIGAVAFEKTVRIDIVDTGIGIPEAHQQKIFDEFYQVQSPGRGKNPGLGLGLSIVRILADRLPGHCVRFSSKPGQGTRFSIHVPRCQRQTISPDVLPHPANKDIKGAYIVIVDDDPRLLQSMDALMSSMGAIVRTADSSEALDTLLARAPDRYPNLLITDWRLRQGETGHDIMRRIASQFDWAVVPVIILSAEIQPPIPSPAPEIFYTVNKTGEMSALLQTINQAIAAGKQKNATDAGEPATDPAQ